MISKLLGPAVIGGVVMAAQAASAQQAFYVSGSLGAFMRQDESRSAAFHNEAGLTRPGTNTTSFDPGPAVNLGVGYRLPLGFRIEGELGYAHFQTSTATPLSTDGAFPGLNGSRLGLASGGDHNLFTATVNGFFDVPVSGRLVPYLGGGVGYYHGETSDAHFIEANGQRTFIIRGGSSDGAVILAEVGLTFKLDDKWSISPAYRFDHFFVASGPDANVHLFKVGVRYAF